MTKTIATHSLSTEQVKSSGRFYRPELDALRFFAFLCVFLHHVGRAAFDQPFASSPSSATREVGRVLGAAFEAGSFGMCLFFLLSAYLITELLLLERARTGTVSVKNFYVRRVLRIWPLYFSFLLLMVGLGWLWPSSFHVEGSRIAAFLLLAGNWYVLSHTFFPRALSVLWSISIEEQFYLLWPGIVRYGRGRTGILAGAALFALASLATLAYLGISGEGNQGRIWMNSLVQFLFFAAGALLALRMGGRRPNFPGGSRASIFVGGGMLWLGAEYMTGIKREGAIVHSGALIGGYLAVALGTTCIFLACLGISRVPKVLTYLGKISYGLYVFHVLTLQVTMIVLGRLAHAALTHWAVVAVKAAVPICALAVTIVLASASYSLLEKPFLRLRRRFTTIPSRPA